MASKTFKKTLIAATVATFLSPLAQAQDEVLEEIIVTARQSAESLFEVPAAISVITSSQIEGAGVQRAEDFIRLIPGVSIVDAAEVGDTQVNIRGINGARDAENSFAFVVDGILMTNPAAFNREFGNLSQIEVLKGPQGAIYGRNAAAGAVVVTTNRPGDEQSGKFKVSAAEDSTMFASATFGGPVNDSVGYQIHADYRTTDGYYTNSFLNDDIVDDFENYSIGGRLIIEPSDTTSWDIKARYAEVDAGSITFNAAFALPDFATVLGIPQFFEDVNDHQFVFEPNIDPTNDQDALEISVKFETELERANLTAWMLYSDINNAFGADGTSGAFGFFNGDPECINTTAALSASGFALPLPQILAPTPAASIFGPYTPTACDGTQYQERNQSDLSFEVRLSGQANDDVFWQLGMYYLNLEREVGVNLGVDRGQGIDERLFSDSTFNPTEQLVFDRFDTDVLALFGRLDYDLADNFNASLALRYDREDRDVTNLVPTEPRSIYVDFVPDGVQVGGAPLNPALDPAINPNGVIPTQTETFSQLQPKLSFSWLPAENFTVFGSWGIGFKSGGFNSQGSNATVDIFFNGPLGFTPPLVIEDRFEKETSSAFELGFRANPSDRWFIEGALYSVNVDDMQFFEFLTGPYGLLRVVSNIDEVSLEGIEFAVNFEATDNLSFGLGYNVTDSEIEANSARPETVGNESPYTPDYTANATIDWVQPIGSGDWTFNANVTWSVVGNTWFHTVQDETRRTLFDLAFGGLGTADYSLTERDSYSVGNVRLGVSSENWSITAFANNVTDEEYLEEVIPAPEFGGSFISPGTLRRAGVEVTYSF